MAENRVDREVETREKTARRKHWQRPETLPSPEPRPGYAHRWIRVSSRGVTDATNVSSKLREGWEPVKAVDYPDITLVDIEQEKFADNIVIGGLLLCEAPVEMVGERSEYYEAQTESQMRSVDNNLMRESDPRMPIFNDRKTSVTFGSGT